MTSSGQIIPGDSNVQAAGWTVQNSYYPAPSQQIAAFTSLNAATANGPGTAVDFGRPVMDVSVEVTTTGSPTGGTVTLLVSEDGTTFVASTATVTVGANPATVTLSNVGWRYARTDLSGLTGGTSPTVTAKVMGSA